MSGVPHAGGRLPVEGRNAHARHQRAHVCTPDRETLPIQLFTQHTRPHERVLQVQRVLATHQHQIGRSLAELPFPLRNLVGMHLKPLCQFGQRLVAAHSGQRNFGFEHR